MRHLGKLGKTRRFSRLFLAAAATVCCGGYVRADDNWTDGTGFWNTPSNWSAGVPTSGSNVGIIDSDGVARGITYNYPGPGITLGTLTIDLTNGSGGATNSLAIPSGSIFTSTEIIGGNGNGAISQSGGKNTVVTGALIIGEATGSTGSYSLSFGNLNANTGDGNGIAEYVGFSGVGTLNQSGGLNQLIDASNGILVVGYNLNSVGTYVLSSGAVDANGTDSNNASEYVGYSGVALFNQSGGPNNLAADLQIGFNSGSTGTYILSGNPLQQVLSVAGSEWLGTGNSGPASGNFNQIGGGNYVRANLNLGFNFGSVGTYTLTGGTCAVSSDVNAGINPGATGVLNVSGGQANITGSLYIGGSASGAGGAGSLIVGGSGTLYVTGSLVGYNTTGSGITLTGGTINTPLLDLNGSPSLLNWSAGTLQILNTLTLDSTAGPDTTAGVFGASLILSGGQNLSVVGNENIGGTGSFSLKINGGGGNNVNGALTIFATPGSGVTLNGGTVNVVSLNINGVPSLFNWLSGTLGFLQNVTFDSQAGPTTSGGAFGSSLALGTNRSIITFGNEIIGDSSTFDFNLGDGINRAGVLYVGNAVGSSGTYTIGDTGTLTGGTEIVGYSGVGSLSQSGGLNTIAVNQALLLGYNAGSTGTYTLSGTGLIIPGRDHYPTDEIVGRAGTGIFNQTGGTNQLPIFVQLLIGDGVGSTGTYLLSGNGTIASSDSEYVGIAGVGFFNQSGGLNTTNSIGIGASGTYTLSGTGSLSVGTESVTGSFVQSGGTLAAQKIVVYSAGKFLMSGGAFGGGTLDISHGMAIFPSVVLDSGFPVPGFAVPAGSTTPQIIFESGSFVGGINEYLNGSFTQPSTLVFVPTNLFIGQNGQGTSVYNLASGKLSASAAETVGVNGDGVLNQTGGINMITGGGGLYLGLNGGSSGSYSLNGTASLLVSGNEYVGNNGSGIFSQNGGINAIGGTALFVGSGSGGPGTYVLSGGTLSSSAINVQAGGLFSMTGGALGCTTFNVAGGVASFPILSLDSGVPIPLFNLQPGTVQPIFNLSSGGLGAVNAYLGNSGGVSNFAQTGGVVLLPSVLTIGGNSNSTATYTLSGVGSLAAGNLLVGGGGTGDFIQNGGFNTSSTLALTPTAGGSGSYELEGGSLSVGLITVGASASFTQTGGSLSFTTFNQNNGSVSIPGLTLGNGNSYSFSGGTLTAVTINVNSGGLFSITAGALTGSSVNLNGGTAFFPAIVLDSGAPVLVSNSPPGGTTPGLTLTSGTLGAANEYLGYAGGSSSFNQSAGVSASLKFNPTRLFIGYDPNSTADYRLGSGGTLSVGNSEYVGYGGTGSFIQTGGANVAPTIYVAALAGSNGFFTLSAGNVNCGSLYIAGSNSASGGTGLLTVNAAGHLNVAGPMKVWGSGRVNLDVPFTTVANLIITAGGILNLNGAMAINYGSPANDPVSTVVNYLKSGFNGGTWTGTSGIISTSAQSQIGPAVSVGYVDGKTDVGTVAARNQIVLKYTLTGDATLDGAVNFNDLVAVVQNFNKPGTDWAQGNFLYGASTNFNDLVAVVQNFNRVLPPAGGTSEELGNDSTLLSAGNSVPLIQSTDVQLPEPGGVGAAVIGATGFLVLRRRVVNRKMTG